MESTLSVTFMCLSGASLLLVLWALWNSVASLLSRSDLVVAGHVSGAERDALLGEKRALLQTLRDLEFERQTGKLSEADFGKLNLRYRERAKEVLRALDEQLSGYREQARVLIAAELAGPDEAPEEPGSTGVEQSADAPATCAACDTKNDTDAVFCKKCGKALGDAGDAGDPNDPNDPNDPIEPIDQGTA